MRIREGVHVRVTTRGSTIPQLHRAFHSATLLMAAWGERKLTPGHDSTCRAVPVPVPHTWPRDSRHDRAATRGAPSRRTGTEQGSAQPRCCAGRTGRDRQDGPVVLRCFAVVPFAFLRARPRSLFAVHVPALTLHGLCTANRCVHFSARPPVAGPY